MSAAQLESIAREHKSAVRQVLQEYSQLLQRADSADHHRLVKERQVDRAVRQFVAVQRALRKLRQKMVRE
jgi:hypothetical protein